MNYRNIRAIIVDLDGTLLHTDKSISTYTLKTLEKCKEQGISIIVATARPYRNTLPYTKMVEFDAMVVSNGARIVYQRKREERIIPKETALKFVQALAQHDNLRITLETSDSAYSNYPVAEYWTIIAKDLAPIIEEEMILKVLVHLDTKETQAIVQKEMSESLHYSISQGYLMQIMDTSATKWNGVKTILEHLQCDIADAVYFGDDNDDIGPIRSCGLGVAVANGIPAVKAVADAITESNDHDGVAKFIERQILKV